MVGPMMSAHYTKKNTAQNTATCSLLCTVRLLSATL